jgi:hypothetical protein
VEEVTPKPMPSEEVPKKLPIIDSELLREFHAVKGIKDISCHRCGNGSWFIHSSHVGACTGLPSATDDSRASIELFTPVLTLSCSNCGTLWMMALERITDWIAQTKSNAKEQP